MLKEQYEQILAQLKTDASDLAKRHPDLAVSFQRENTDPDVARLLEGVALIAARQRQHLADDQIEQQQGWLQSVAPDILKPIPAMVLANVDASPHVREIPAGMTLTANAGGQAVYWQAAVPTTLLPLDIASLMQSDSDVQFALSVLGECNIANHPFTLQMTGDGPEFVQQLHGLIANTQAVIVSVNEQQFSLDSNVLQVKYQVSDGSWLQPLLDRFDQPSVPRWLTELWCNPARGLALSLDLSSLSELTLQAGDQLAINLQLRQPLSHKISADQWTTNAVPLVNLKQSNLLPFSRQKDRSIFELSMMNENESTDQLVSLLSVQENLADQEFNYVSIGHLAAQSPQGGVYQLLRQNSAPRLQIRLQRTGDGAGLVQLSALVHQGDVASGLPSGTQVSGNDVTGSFITSPSQWINIPNTQTAQWKALRVQQAASKKSDLASLVEQLTVLLPPAESHYEAYRRLQRFIDALVGLQIVDSPITRGTSLILGQEVVLHLNMATFPVADAWLFCTIIWQLMRGRLAVNSVMALKVINEKNETVFTWSHASGTRSVV